MAGLFGLSGAIRKMSPAAVLDRSIPLNVVDRQVVARDQDVVALTLAPVDGHRLPRWHPGAHLDLHLPKRPGAPVLAVRRPRRHRHLPHRRSPDHRWWRRIGRDARRLSRRREGDDARSAQRVPADCARLRIA